MTKARYIQREVDPDMVEHLRSGGMPNIIAKLLASRGVINTSEVDSGMGNLLKPASMKGCKEAGKLLAEAVHNGKKISVVADYDCDGASACAVMLRGLKLLGAQPGTVSYLVPDRKLDGYGLTASIVDRVMDKFAPDVLVTVDNGIASFEGVAHGIEAGMKVVVTDHHLPAVVDGVVCVPDATVLVDPWQPGCEFGSKAICGAGVAFYTILMTRSALRDLNVFDVQTQPRLDSLLELVALATVTDVVKLDQNNRRLVWQGLERIRSRGGNAGIRAIFEVAGRNPGNATSTDLGFSVGPRINAAGRLSDMSLGIECLLTDDPAHAKTLATELHKINQQRREVETGMFDEADSMLKTFPDAANDSAIVVFDQKFHEGLVGLVAGRLKEARYRPTFAFATSNEGDLKGSGRSIPGFHMRDALDLLAKRNPGLILRFGGHAMAAGCTIRSDGLDTFRNGLRQIANEWLSEDMLGQKTLTDGVLANDDFCVATVKLLDSQIWGNGFEPPMFVNKGTVIAQKLVGEKHLKLTLSMDGQRREGIWFGRTEPLPDKVEVAYQVGINAYQGRESVQMIVNGLA